ncbi:hypothetical protein [Nocardiopsis sp. MG754419]|uniref:hypothetical protein n=1 Tax=Nocardiopsis sp. MG754419 TaxID=2259865 RepID=UPI001BAC5BDD|nr:hypothetical protein [Nocardiopsis sp. MG754419]MBR8744185.1 hypothetical protein [Nocardiopsis sp. MG754419]
MDGAECAEGGRSIPFPRAGTVAAIAAVAFMGLVSVHLWSALPDPVPSGERDLDGAPSTVPRGVFVSVLPLAALLLVGVFALVVRVGSGFQRAPGRAVPWSSPSLRRVLNLFLLLMALLLATVHTVALHDAAGRMPEASADRLIALSVAAFLVGMGLIVPLLRVEAGRDGAPARRWHRARVAVGVVVGLLGVLSAAAAFLLPGPVVAAASMVLVGPVILAGRAVPRAEERK